MSTPRVLLTVGANRRNLELLAQFLGKEGYQLVAAATLEEFDQAMDGSQELDLALVDISGFDRDIWERCERLRAKDIPLLVISAKQSVALQQQSLNHGARGVLVKPLVVRELIMLVRNLIAGSA